MFGDSGFVLVGRICFVSGKEFGWFGVLFGESGSFLVSGKYVRNSGFVLVGLSLCCDSKMFLGGKYVR